ncbi:hypothetical protein, conserved [Babesia bigemina]|uniref:PH domain-containing protein n=1 Tax=Babesia bigemina TaxID=5866 RepID=A0A061D455_BABBI|nr:hypothetical protein, conserved [Babesia bigemina]CDR93759.1 hypothetical protein, conserved [Babesia bigemina]|eukprot:XP_012765945.1 hypothetical protein, conserved [Babesia bigemina]
MTNGYVGGIPLPVEKSAGYDFGSMDDADGIKRAVHSPEAPHSARMKGDRRVLEELQKEARELLSLSYGLRAEAEDAGNGGLDSYRSGSAPSRPPSLISSPRLNLNPQTKQAIESKWAQDSPRKACKLLPTPEMSKACKTDKLLDVRPDSGRMERNTGDFTSLDVLDPVPHLEKRVSYPLDLSVRDICGSSPLVANATREGYREMLTALQQKYTVVLRMFDEINEQRMSYIEGLHELQGHLDNARSVMQLQKAEIAKLNGRAQHHEAAARQVAKDLERCHEALSVRMRHEAQLEAQVREKDEFIQDLMSETETLKASVGTLNERIRSLSFMPELAGNAEFAGMSYTYGDAVMELQELINKLSTCDLAQSEFDGMVETLQQKTGALRYLETLIKCPLTSNLADFYRQRFILADRFKDEVLKIHEDKEKELERNYERTQQLIDTYAARVHQANADSLSARTLLETYVRRTTMCAAPPVSTSKVAARVAKALRAPVEVMIAERPLVGAPHFRTTYVRVTDDALNFCRVKAEKLSVKSSVPLKDIRKLEFGYNSASYIFNHNLVKPGEAFPWHFFTLVTAKREYNMLCTDDTMMDVIYIGINHRIAGQCFMVNVVDISRMRLLRAKTKLHWHCQTHNITPRRMWLNAIRKTVESQTAAAQ